MTESYKFKSGLQTKNRIVLAPLTNNQSPGSVLSPEELRWLTLRMEGGFGIVTTCATHIMPSAQGWPGEMGIFSPEHLSGLKALAQNGRAHSCLVIPQLFHGGFRSPKKLTGVQPVSASEFVLDLSDFEKPRALNTEEIINIKDHFVKAAQLSMDAGLPGVEIHGANNYLFTQFLSSHTNTRTDEWGGSKENRARFLLETAQDIRAAIGRNKILGVRLSPESTKIISQIPVDDMMWVASELANVGVDYISLSLMNARKKPDEYPNGNDSIVALFRKAIPKEVALSVAGNIWTRSDAETVLRDGADFVVLGSSGIVNPDWPLKVWQKGFAPDRAPLSEVELQKRGLSPAFIEYIRPRGFVV
jgi:2,4-dienoyl-CoA reductase-like NADH-dependent reductase (Old Yellow Enzyme family)